MNEIQLNNGVIIPQLGLGVYKAQDGAETENAVKWALEAGYRHIDTAKYYQNEKSVGRAIKESGIPRRDIFLTTKIWTDDIRAGRTEEAFEKSLCELGTDYVDLYLIHWPVEGYEKAWAVLEKIYKEGRARAIGVSNFQIHHLRHLAEVSNVKPAVNQIESHPYFNNQEVIDYCLNHDIAAEVWRPLGGTGSTLLQDKTLHELAEKYGRTPAQIVIRWDIQRNVIVFPKSTHKDRIISNLNVFDFELSAEDMAAVGGLNKNERIGGDPDHISF